MKVRIGTSILRHIYQRRLTRASRYLSLLFALWIGALPGSIAAIERPAAVPFRYVKGFAVIIPISINGSGPYDFMLDTGSTCTAVDRELGQSLRLELKNKATVTTLARRMDVSVAVARTVKVGSITASQIELLVRDFDGLRRLDPALRGVLGQDVLSQADFLIDYQHRSIQFDRDGEVLRSLSGERTPLIKSTDRNNLGFWIPGVHTTIEDGAPHGRTLVLDSGTASLVLFADRPLPSPTGLQSAVQDDGGMQQSARLRTVTLHLGHKIWLLPAQEVVLRNAGSDLSGLLPTSLFRSVYLSNSGGFVLFEPARPRFTGRDRRRPIPSEAPMQVGELQ